ncbi:hypothetical protein [Paenibacillus albidus]|uniref:hypothetical protein n=1 Tax=Paenibacillus albidus TaxID=2041023 RepID=UPI00203643A2|nr:hypothetical protein [Paenibacillus albidus]
MNRFQGRLILLTGTVLSMLLLQACGQDRMAEGQGESFAAAREENVEAVEDGAGSHKVQTPAPLVPSPAATDNPAVVSAAPKAEKAAASPVPAPLSSAKATSSPPATQEPVPTMVATVPPKETPSIPPVTKKKPVPKESEAPPSPVSASGAKSDAVEKKSPPAPTATVQPAASPSQDVQSQNAPSADGPPAIEWGGFFDGSDQTRPSEQFWDLSGSEVTIKGFMGEVLSFEKNWFLLIPEPGAECPFDNGDETYWNKIMIVFVPEGSKLRHTSDPLQIKGRLDVGIKIDESGYKTMFRLYDASFTPL